MKISEIAYLAGVSSAAVSRYLNGGSISEHKKQKIRKVIEETGYVPNIAARSLRRKRSDSVGIIVPKINSDSVSNLVEGISLTLNQVGFLAIFGNAENDELRETEYLRLMQEAHLAGIILLGTVFTPQHTQIFRESSVPIVVCGQSHPDVSCVYHDDSGAAYTITECLLKKGRTKIAYIGVDESDERVGLLRRQGVEKALSDFGINPDTLKRTQVFFTVEDGYTGMNEILNSGYLPDGVVCATDSLAVGAMKSLKEHGLQIPKDVSIGGIGGGTAGTIITPTLTTVQLYYRDCGQKAAELLLSMINHQQKDSKEKLPVSHTMLSYTLIERKSV